MRWLLVFAAVAFLGCGKSEQPDKDKPASGPAQPKPSAKLGADAAVCEKLAVRIEELYAANASHALASMTSNKEGEHYRRVMHLCTRWSAADDRACIDGAADFDALRKCASPILGNYDAIDDRVGVAKCEGGVVDKLACPEGSWSNGKICAPVPAGFTVTDTSADVLLSYPDGGEVSVSWEEAEDCGKERRRLLEGRYAWAHVETFAECRWADGAFAVLQEEGRDRKAKALLCGGAVLVKCRAKGSEQLERACAGLQVLK